MVRCPERHEYLENRSQFANLGSCVDLQPVARRGDIATPVIRIPTLPGHQTSESEPAGASSHLRAPKVREARYPLQAGR